MGFRMKKIIFAIMATLVLVTTGYAEKQTLQEHVQEACKEDKAKFCSQVRPGQERMLACAYAHEDKLSGQCLNALYEAAAILDAAVETLNYLAHQCKDDVKAWCGNVKIGEGRILTCLDENHSKLKESCKTALTQTVEKK